MTSESKYLLVLTHFPDMESARKVALELVESQLVACVNIHSDVRSIYEWKGKIEQETEVAVHLKTCRENWPQLETTLASLHPYDVPGIVALPIEAGSEPFLDWISKQTKVLSKEEQMAQFEKALKEDDWGHQPC